MQYYDAAKIRHASWILAMAAAAIGSAVEDSIAYDQRNDPLRIPPTFQSICLLGPIGQEFVPAATALNRVELFVADFDGRSGAQLQVTIRRGAIDGPIKGKSKVLTNSAG